MRILFAPASTLVSDRRPHGEATISFNILKRLAARRHQVTAYVERAECEIRGVEFREVSSKAAGAVLSRLAWARRIARDASSLGFDVVHTLFPTTVVQGYTLVEGAPLLFGPLTLPWPSSDGGATARSRMVSAVAGGAVNLIERRLHRQTLERAAAILVSGRPALDALPERAQAKCIEVPFGVDVSRFTGSPLPEEPVILFLSVLLPRKGYDVLLRALPLVRQRVPRARLILAGHDPRSLVEHARGLASELGVADMVEFAGPVEPADAPAMHRRARVFCQPSLGEPFGLTILEAMASGRPVVATSAGGVPGFMRHGVNGALVPPGDSQLLADALSSLLEDRAEAVGIGEWNRDEAVRRFDWDRVVDRLEEAYEHVTGAGRERRAG